MAKFWFNFGFPNSSVGKLVLQEYYVCKKVLSHLEIFFLQNSGYKEKDKNTKKKDVLKLVHQ